MGSEKKSEGQELSKWRTILWPIYPSEMKKFMTMTIMFFCIVFNFAFLRAIKDSLVITTMGAEALPTLKLWFVMPATVLFVLIYAKLLNVFSKDKVFHIVVSSFFVYFVLFATVFYPFQNSLHPTFSNDYGVFVKKLLLPIEHWTFSSFYVIAELWSSVIINLLFWKFANETTSLMQSKRFYSMFGLIANTALIFSGGVLKNLEVSGSVGDQWTDLPKLISFISILCLVIMGLYYYLTNYILKDPVNFNPDDIKKPKSKVKLSISESFKCIMNSRYLGFITLLLVCYGISINLVEIMWKAQVRELCPTKGQYMNFMGGLQIWTGIVTIIGMIVGANVLRKTTWKTAAMITPVVIFITGLIFFGFILFKDALDPCLREIGLTALGVVVCVGLIQNVLTKSMKYSLFDATKEMSYIPLDEELKSKGKAAVDVIAQRAGKSGGSAIQFLLLNVIFVGSSLVELAPIISGIFAVIVFVWFYAVSGLNDQFLKITAEHNKK